MKNVMRRAWEIYRTLTGDHTAKLAMALKAAWAETKSSKLPEIEAVSEKQRKYAEDLRNAYIAFITENGKKQLAKARRFSPSEEKYYEVMHQQGFTSEEDFVTKYVAHDKTVQLLMVEPSARKIIDTLINFTSLLWK